MSIRPTKLKKALYIIFSIIILLLITVAVFMQQARFGKLPEGADLTRIKQSPQYQDGIFQNQSPTPTMAGDKSKLRMLYEFFFQKVQDLRPAVKLPVVKQDLKALNPVTDLLIWLGHSSLYLHLDGKRILVDPVLVAASPVSFVNKSFKGVDVYTPADLPPIDYVLLTHDHWDHMDYETLLHLKDQVSKIVCPLGVGAHLIYWGFDPQKIIEQDWFDEVQLDAQIKLHTLPARHFSGRGLKPNKSLWASYMLQSSFGNIYLSGDTGYDKHFEAIKKRFDKIDLAIMENGQYNADWRYIHMMPEDLLQAVKDLEPMHFITVHNAKYALGKHAWYEPLDNIYAASAKEALPLITPMIGETLLLDQLPTTAKRWW